MPAHEQERQHADRYADLPEHTKDFLEGLRPEEVEILQDAIRLMVAKRAVGAWGKARVTLAAATFLGAVALLKGWEWLTDWMRPDR